MQWMEDLIFSIDHTTASKWNEDNNGDYDDDEGCDDDSNARLVSRIV